jgi:hypothetical protein
VAQQRFENLVKDFIDYRNVPEASVGQLFTLTIESACFVTQQGSGNFAKASTEHRNVPRPPSGQLLTFKIESAAYFMVQQGFVNRPHQNTEKFQYLHWNWSLLLSSMKLAS